MNEKLYTGEAVKGLIRSMCPDGITMEAEDQLLATIPTVQAHGVPSRDELRNKIGCIDAGGDNVAIALASYFEGHMGRPENDRDDDLGWGPWVVEQTNAVLDRIGHLLAHTPQEQKPMVPSVEELAKFCLINYGTEPGNWTDARAFEDCAYETAQAIHAHLLDHGYREPVGPSVEDCLPYALALQEISEAILKEKGVKRTKKSEELWKSIQCHEAGLYSAYFHQVIKNHLLTRTSQEQKPVVAVLYEARDRLSD